MPSVAVDSGPLIALFNKSDRQRERALPYFRSSQDKLVTNIAVITEVAHMLDFSNLAVCAFLDWAERALITDNLTGKDLSRINQILRKYADLPADFADASLVALYERCGMDGVATFDSHFTVYRLSDGRPLNNVFASH